MKNIKQSTGSILALTLLLVNGSAYALSTSAAVNTTTNGASTDVKADAKVEVKTKAMLTRIETAKTHAAQEIDRRITALLSLKARVDAMVKVSTDEKTSIGSFIQGQVDLMNNLKTKIAADTEIDVIKTDIKSITDSYRVFSLVIPQGHIIATTDAMVSTSDLMASLGAKLQARIEAAKAAGKDTKALETLLADYATQIADAKVQAQAAVSVIAPLKPDEGDKATQDANKKAFADAKAKIKAGRTDLGKARDDAKKIVAALKAMKLDVNMTATSTTNVQ